MKSSSYRARNFATVQFRSLCWLMLLSCLLFTPGSVLPADASSKPQASESTIPDALQQWVQKSVEAVNTHHPDALAPFANGDAKRSFAWVSETTTKHWESGVLRMDDAPEPGYLAVFHAWHGCESDGDHVHKLVPSGQTWRLGEEIPETETGGFLVRDHNLTLHFDVPNHGVAVTDTVKIEHVGTTPTNFCLLRLSEDFHVRVFRHDSATGANVPFQQVGGVLLIPAPAEANSTFYLEYAGTVNHSGSDYFRSNEATLDSYWYPNIARLPATSTVTATAPPGWTPLAQGELVHSSNEADGSATVTYRNDIPVSFFTVDIGKYTITRRQAGKHTLYTYLLSADSKLANACLDTLEHAMDFYEKSFAPFPYTRYTVVQTDGPFDGALEAYSFATFGPHTLPATIPHELAHTWWGGLIPCTYTRSMWNESFADYSDGLFQRVVEKHEAPLDGGGRAGELRKVPGMPFSEFSLVTAHDTTDNRQAGVGYIKGGLVLRVLEDQLGQETMLKCMATFAADHHRGDAAEWPDFEAAVDKVTGADYRWFFSEWTERTGLPVIQWSHVTTHKDGSDTVIEGDIVQSGTPYRLQIMAVVDSALAHVSQPLTIEEAQTHIVLRSTGTPVRLVLDPQGVVPFGHPSSVPNHSDPTVYNFPAGSRP